MCNGSGVFNRLLTCREEREYGAIINPREKCPLTLLRYYLPYSIRIASVLFVIAQNASAYDIAPMEQSIVMGPETSISSSSSAPPPFVQSTDKLQWREAVRYLRPGFVASANGGDK